MSNLVSMDSSSWETMQQQAKILLQSDMLPSSIRTEAQVITIILKAKELGVPPMEGLSSINVNQRQAYC